MNTTKRVTLASLSLMAMFLLTGCGQSGTAVISTASSAYCSTGYVYSSTYGCLLQSTCSTGYGLYNGSCVLATSTTLSTSGCASIAGTIPFYGTGLEIDSSNDIYGGTFPGYSTLGSIIVGSTGIVSGTTFTSVSTGTTYSVGTFGMNVALTGTSYASSSATVSGALTIGAYYQTMIQEYLESIGYTTSAACVSGIALQGHLYTTGSYGFGGNVYLYLNGLQHGVVLTYE